MVCRSCHFDNPPGMKFCGACGTRLEALCPDCQTSNPPGFKFCGNCGGNLSLSKDTTLPKDLSFDEKLAKIQKYLPGGLTEKILSQRDRIEGERRHVTIMFVDMKGFTPLTEKLGPEETFSLMDKVFELIIHKVHDYEGTVNELRGDGVLAFFGAPIALEDAPQRAIRSSLAIHRELTRFNDKLKSEKNTPPVLVRVGINSGPVVVGTIGNDLRVQFTAVGDTINMAARMEQLAEPGTTYVTEDTFKLTEGYFRFEALGEKEIKGKEKPLKVYQVIAPSTRRTRFDVSAERGLSKFIGRERELDLLLDAFERAKAGRGQAVSIMGEAGVGKSRLLYEFRKAVANEDIVFLEGKCLSYGRGLSYHPIIDILKSNFGVEEGDTDSAVTAKVQRGLTMLGVDEIYTLPYLLELLSVKDSGIDKISMSPEARKDRIHAALQRIVLKGSEQRSLAFVVEDLHWMDKSSEDATKYLLESVPAARVLMIFTYRPEYVHTWGGKTFHSQVNLNRLSKPQTLALVVDFLGSDDIAADLQELIVEKTEGIPFFIEEFVRALKDMEILERTDHRYHLAEGINRVTIPSTIQDVIMARVDSLPGAATEVLQAGSAIDREFGYKLIKAVTELPEPELLPLLSLLKASELLYERGVFPQSTFIFRHALTREVVYDSILVKRKKLLHENIGNAIEEICTDNISDYYGALVEHFLAGENYEKGAKYAKLASKKAEKAAAFNDTILYTEKGIACLERLPPDDEVSKKIIDARTVLGVYLSQLSNVHEAKQAIDPIIETAAQRGYSRQLSQIYTIAGHFEAFAEENFPRALEHLNQAVEIADRVGNLISVALAHYWLAFVSSLDCQFQQAFSNIQKSLKINMAANNLWGASVMKSNWSLFHFWHGQIELSYRTGKEALKMAEQSGDMYSKMWAQAFYGISCYGRGAFGEALDNLSESAHFGERVNFLVLSGLSEHFRAETYSEIREHESAENHFRKSVGFYDRCRQFASFSNLSRMGLEKSQALRANKCIELVPLRHYVRDNRVKAYDGWTRRYLAEILMIIDDQHFPEAQHWIEEAIEADKRNQMMFHLGRDHAVYAELFKRKGDKEKAKEQLGKAIDIYKECGADGWVTRAEEDMAKLQ